ncbi:MAG: diguanylate cyclase [Verrucomicrobiota bacterium]|nr:diguanylate cyclase [Verrucomicrobiota bacterium]
MSKLNFDFSAIVQNAKDVVIVTKSFPIDAPGPEIIYVNDAFTETTGYSAEEVIGKTPRIFQKEGTDKEELSKIREALEKKEPVRVTLRNFSKSGKEYWVDISILPLRDTEGVVTHFASIQRDITEYKKLEQDLQILCRTDPLTTAANRRAFNEILSQEFSRFKRSQKEYALIMIDLDHFKSINDQHGHSVGDQVLIEVTERCKDNIRVHDIMARLGGEEFCILLPYTDSDQAKKVAERLREKIEIKPIIVDGLRVKVTISVGISLVSTVDEDGHQAMERADQKLFQAKESGRNRICA